MEELKLLIDMVAKLPAMALWVLVGFWAYKVICIGSIYGVIRLAIIKAHEVLIARKTVTKDVEVRLMLDGLVISGAKEALWAQLHRVRNKKHNINSTYIHANDVDWLRVAIDEKEKRDAENET